MTAVLKEGALYLLNQILAEDSKYPFRVKKEAGWALANISDAGEWGSVWFRTVREEDSQKYG